MKKLLLLILFFPLIGVGQGWDLTLESKFDYQIDTNDITRSILPYSHDLTKYAPPVVKQLGGTCLGHAVCYSALSIMHNQRTFKYPKKTNYFLNYAFAFDPYFHYIYTKSNIDSSYNYEFGCRADLLEEFLKNYGAKRWALPAHKVLKKDRYSYEDSILLKEVNKDFVIDGFTNLKVPGISKKKFVKVIKEQISNNIPVIIGAETHKGKFAWQNGRFVQFSKLSLIGFLNKDDSLKGLLDLSYLGDNPTSKKTGHAMTIIGYSNKKFGGAFKIMNSWGSDWGDGFGFCWVRYKDIYEFANKAYVINLTKNQKYLNGYTTYIGSEKKNLKHGVGFEWNGKGYFFGRYKNGKPDGCGLLFLPESKIIYEGYFSEGVLQEIEDINSMSNIDRYMHVLNGRWKMFPYREYVLNDPQYLFYKNFEPSDHQSISETYSSPKSNISSYYEFTKLYINNGIEKPIRFYDGYLFKP